MSDVGDGHVVVLTPEKRHELARDPLAEHVLGGDLSLSFGHDPVLDPQLLPRVRIGPPSDVAGGKDARGARFKVLVDHDASIDRDTRFLGQLGAGSYSDANDD